MNIVRSGLLLAPLTVTALTSEGWSARSALAGYVTC